MKKWGIRFCLLILKKEETLVLNLNTNVLILTIFQIHDKYIIF